MKKLHVIQAYFFGIFACVAALSSGCTPARTPVANVAKESAPNQVDARSQENETSLLGLHTKTTRLEFRPQPKDIIAGESSIWGLKVIDLKTGKGTEDFKLAHEKLMHLIVVSKDLSWFNHIHPQHTGYGNFVTQVTLPRAGTYKLYADYTPIRAEQEVAQKEFVVMPRGSIWRDSTTKLIADKITNNWMTKTVRAHPESKPDAPSGKPSGKTYQVALMPMPAQIKVGEEAMLHFQVRDAQGVPVKDLQPYLGARGHAVLLSQDTNIYLHTHPMGDHAAGDHAMGDMDMSHESHESAASGGDVMFHTTFPTAGLYKVWGQFQREGQIITAPFVVNVVGKPAVKGALKSAAKAVYSVAGKYSAACCVSGSTKCFGREAQLSLTAGLPLTEKVTLHH